VSPEASESSPAVFYNGSEQIHKPKKKKEKE